MYDKNNKKWLVFQSLLVGLSFIISSFVRLATMDDFSLLILDFSSISFSFAFLSFVLAKNIYKYEIIISNAEQEKEQQEQKEFDGAICWFFSFIFLLVFVALEIYQTKVMTNGNTSGEPYWLFIIFIFLSIILLTLFMKFSIKLRKNYKLKISILI